MGKVLVWHVTVRLLQNDEGDKREKERRGEVFLKGNFI